MIRALLRAWHRHKLAKLVEATKRDPRTGQFIRRRNAALRHVPKKWLVDA